MEDLLVVEDPETATMVFDPVRRSLLAALREPASAAGLADTVGMSRQRVSYYLGSLDSAGLVRQVGERRWGGITERLFVATAASYTVSVEALGELAGVPERVQDKLSASFLVALASQAIRDVGQLLTRSRTERRRLATFSVDARIRFANGAERQQFADDLAAAVGALAARYHQPESRTGREHHLVVLTYPSVAERVA